MESAHRAALANGLVGIRERKLAPTLADFLKRDFVPFAESKHAAKPLTLRYYRQGADMLTASSVGRLRLDELTSQHAQEFARKHSALSPSGINRGLRTLRRALNLAYQWQRLEKPVKVSLVSGEHQRDRVLTLEESQKYLSACPQPWKDCATVILDERFRPSEVFALGWQHIDFGQGAGLIQITEGKSKAARRILPMTPRVREVLLTRWEDAGRPVDGFVFPSASKTGHFNGDAAKDQHAKALEIPRFRLSCPTLCGTRRSLVLVTAAGGDVFVLARIAGHSSITITQRYVHPQADAISRVFSQVGTKLGTVRRPTKKTPLKTKRPIALKCA